VEQRFAVLAEGEKPKNYKVPHKIMAGFINEFPFRQVEIFETLIDAEVAAGSLAERFETRHPTQNEERA
jgi:hypothetical protein